MCQSIARSEINENWLEGETVSKRAVLDRESKRNVRDWDNWRSSGGKVSKQGCYISHTLCNIHLEEIIITCFNGKGGITNRGKKVESIRFADDMVIQTESKIKSN